MTKNKTVNPHQQTLYQFNGHQSSSEGTITVHQQTYIIYYPVTYCHQTLFQFIIHFPNSIPYSSSLYIPSSVDQIILQTFKRRYDYYQFDCHPPSEDPLSVKLFSTPIRIHYSSSSSAIYHLLSCNRLSSGPIPVHYKFPHWKTLFQFIIHSPISISDYITDKLK